MMLLLKLMQLLSTYWGLTSCLQVRIWCFGVGDDGVRRVVGGSRSVFDAAAEADAAVAELSGADVVLTT
jgi:hypothetical protein